MEQHENEIEIAQLERRLESTDFIIESYSENAREHLANAVATMKRAIEDAERELARLNAADSNYTPTKVANRILHAFAWGHANATTSIESASNDGESIAAAKVQRAEILTVLNAAREAK